VSGASYSCAEKTCNRYRCRRFRSDRSGVRSGCGHHVAATPTSVPVATAPGFSFFSMY
jgi:hypothetical protein